MTECHLSWDSYKTNICNGFSHLQQNEEFVDMTLAAEGHLVKVHKNLLALASPYLKEVILSAPCQHPVVFLMNIKHEILVYILEYVYTGEAIVPTHQMEDFIGAAKALHISGVQNIIPPTKLQKKTTTHENNESSQDRETTRDKYDEKNPAVNFNKTWPKNSTLPISLQNVKSQLIQTQDIKETEHSGNRVLTENIQTQQVPSEMHPQDCSNMNGAVSLHTQYQTSLNTVTGLKPVIADLTFVPLKNKPSELPNLQGITPLEDISNIHLTQNVNNSQFMITDIFSEDENNGLDNYTGITARDNLHNDMDVAECSDSFQQLSEPLEDNPETTVNNLKTEKNYSINVEMPAGNVGPPKITIQSGMISNLTIPNNMSSKQINLDSRAKLGDGTDNVPSSSNNSMPIITINTGTIQDVPSININRESNPEPNKSQIGDMDSIGNVTHPLYMISVKNCPQMILNRFIYGLHHHSKRQVKNRWRCIDYRHNHCPAFVDTVGEVIVSRKFLHNHPFHDEKIMNRGIRKEVYESIKEVSIALKMKNQ